MTEPSHSEIMNRDASSVYIQGKLARQRNESWRVNPYEPDLPFHIHWKQGWMDEDNLITSALGDHR